MQANATPEAQRYIPQMKVQKAGRFAFINLSEPNQSKDESLRKLVRSTAMHDFRQKQKQIAITRRSQLASLRHEGSGCRRPSLTTKSHGDRPIGCEDSIEEAQNFVKTMAQPLGKDDPPHPTCNRLDCNENGCKLLPSLQEPIITDPKKLIGDGISDPFNVYPIGGCPRYYSYLLNHCEKIHLQALSLFVQSSPLHSSTHVFCISHFGNGAKLPSNRSWL